MIELKKERGMAITIPRVSKTPSLAAGGVFTTHHLELDSD
jgi:hypothetical protein